MVFLNLNQQINIDIRTKKKEYIYITYGQITTMAFGCKDHKFLSTLVYQTVDCPFVSCDKMYSMQCAI